MALLIVVLVAVVVELGYGVFLEQVFKDRPYVRDATHEFASGRYRRWSFLLGLFVVAEFAPHSANFRSSAAAAVLGDWR